MPLGLQTASLNFETVSEIGQAGKNSQVFLANDFQLASQIVIKKIKKNQLTYENDYYKEAKILYNHEHANIARVNYGCEDDEHVFIAMPYYKNGSLKDLLSERNLTVREIVRYSIQFLSGLNHIHAKKLMHFDIKPDNIFITDRNEAVLADFGLAKAMDKYGNAQQDFVYFKQVPPEALYTEDKSFPFDIYLSGLTLYKMCNGQGEFDSQFASFSGDENSYYEAVSTGNFPNRDTFSWHIPLKLKKIVNKALAVNPQDRHENVLQLINELSGVDQWLDWFHEVDGNHLTWIFDKEDKQFCIKTSNNGNDFSVLTEKKMKSSGNVIKVRDHCIAKILSKDLKKFIQDAFKSLT